MLAQCLQGAPCRLLLALEAMQRIVQRLGALEFHQRFAGQVDQVIEAFGRHPQYPTDVFVGHWLGGSGSGCRGRFRQADRFGFGDKCGAFTWLHAQCRYGVAKQHLQACGDGFHPRLQLGVLLCLADAQE